MAAMSEATARLVLKNAAIGKSFPMTIWEEAQLAWTWLKHNGYEVPAHIEMLREKWPIPAVEPGAGTRG